MCTLCGACAGACPYLVTYKGKVIRTDKCILTEGQCYQYCPRTRTDIDAIYQRIFGVPYDEDKLGTGYVRDVFLARSTDKDILKKAQDGGVVTALLLTALQEDVVDGVVETRKSAEKPPQGFVARNKEELLLGAGNSYEMSPVLETLNRIATEDNDRLGVVALPCQVLAIAKMKAEPPRNRIKIENIGLVIGLFCGWSLSPEHFHEYLRQRFDLSQVIKYDIPHHPAHSFDVHTKAGKTEIDLEEIRQYISPACSYCCDMTSEFADISVGSGRAMFRGWNTVIVRTEVGARVVGQAKAIGLLETQPVPAENLSHLKKAALTKKKRAIRNIVKLTGSKQDWGYLAIKPALRKMLTRDDPGGVE